MIVLVIALTATLGGIALGLGVFVLGKPPPPSLGGEAHSCTKGGALNL